MKVLNKISGSSPEQLIDDQNPKSRGLNKRLNNYRIKNIMMHDSSLRRILNLKSVNQIFKLFCQLVKLPGVQVNLRTAV